MNKKILMLVAVLVVGGLIGYVYGADRAQRLGTNMHMMMGGEQMYDSDMAMDNAMNGMMSGLSNLSGDAFDKAFLSQMIMHHEGAVLMAESALKEAKHQEIKDLSRAIIEAQTKEIDLMESWQKNWYGQ